MLILGIRYLNGWAMAKRVHDVDRPEWPPHPDRVFMALAAAHFETDGSGDEREVLEWLEQLDPPTLITSRCQERDTVTTFVPVNDSADPIKKNKPLMPAGSLSIGRDRQPRTFPVVVAEPAPSGESELYCCLRWDDAVPSDSRTTLLADLCRKVTHVGHSASLVQMWVGAESELPGADDDAWQEFVSGDNLTTGRRLRIPGTGRLTDLEARFNRTAREQYAALKATVDDSRGTQKKKRKADLEERFPTPPTVRRPGTFDETGYVLREPETRQPVVWHSHFDSQLIVLRNVGGQRFGLESTLQLTAALRNAVMAHCPIQPPPEWLSGHKPGSNGPASERETGHLAVVPLPHVDARHSDGRAAVRGRAGVP